LSASHFHFDSHAQVLRLPRVILPEAQKLVESLHRQRRLRRGGLELLSEFYLTAQIDSRFAFFVI
jgi:hypothetical protein